MIDFKISKMIQGETNTAKRPYLQVYVDIIHPETGEKVQINSFFVRGKNRDLFLEYESDKLTSRVDSKIEKLEKELQELKNIKLEESK